MKRLRILAAELERRQNELLEEAILDLLKKYQKNFKHRINFNSKRSNGPYTNRKTKLRSN